MPYTAYHTSLYDYPYYLVNLYLSLNFPHLLIYGDAHIVFIRARPRKGDTKQVTHKKLFG
jgi:hypothetical protein